MSTIREQCLDALLSLVTGQLGTGVGVERSRKRPIAAGTAKFVNIVPEADSRIDTGGINYVDRRLAVDFQITVRGNNPETLADPIVDALHNRLMTARTLSGKCRDIEAADNDFEWDEADDDICVVHQRYAITYRTQETNLSAS